MDRYPVDSGLHATKIMNSMVEGVVVNRVAAVQQRAVDVEKIAVSRVPLKSLTNETARICRRWGKKRHRDLD
jgi:hypothetical protein